MVLVGNFGSLLLYLLFFFPIFASDDYTLNKLLKLQSSNPFEPIYSFQLGQLYQYSNLCDSQGISVADCEDYSISYYLKARELYFDGKWTVTFNFPGMLNDLGILLSRRDPQFAMTIYEDAILLNPNLTTSLANLASLVNTFGYTQRAKDLYNQAISSAPIEFLPQVLYNYGIFALNTLGSREIAREAWEKVISLDQSLFQAWANLAVSACTDEKLSESQLFYDKAIQTAKAQNSTSYVWAFEFQKRSGVIPVIPLPSSSPKRTQNSEKPSNSNMSMESRSLIEIRDSFISGLQTLYLAPPGVSPPLEETVGCASLGYYAIYHGYEDLFLRQQYASSLWHLSSPLLRYVAPFLPSPPLLLSQAAWMPTTAKSLWTRLTPPAHQPSASIIEPRVVEILSSLASHSQSPQVRVGFLSAFFLHHSVGVLLRGVIKGLDRSLFDVYLLRLPTPGGAVGVDSLALDLAASLQPDRLVTLSSMSGESEAAAVSRWRQQAAALSLDVLVLGEVGMDSHCYFLSFSRLARRTISFWGHAVTSGVNEATFTSSPPLSVPRYLGGPDYFFSSFLFEKGPSSQLEYSERLILGDSLTSYFLWPPPPLSSLEVRTLLRQRPSTRLTLPLLSRHLNVSHERLIQHNLSSLLTSLEPSTPSHSLFPLPGKLEFLSLMDPSLPQTLHSLFPSCSPFLDSCLTLYAVPQTLYKLHPDFDSLLLRVLQGDEKALVAFPSPANPIHMRLLKERLRAAARDLLLPSASSPSVVRGALSIKFSTPSTPKIEVEEERVSSLTRRLIFLPKMSEREFLSLCSVADLILDPFPVGGGRSSLECLSTGTPIVALPSRTSILQLTRAMYSIMEREGEGGGPSFFSQDCCLASSEDSFVSMALGLGRDPSLTATFRSRILLSHSSLYENHRVLEDWKDVLLFIATSPLPSPQPSTLESLHEELRNLEALGNQAAEASLSRRSFLRSSLSSLSSDQQWRPSELEKTIFPHPLPPIYMTDVREWLSAAIPPLPPPLNRTQPENSSSPLRDKLIFFERFQDSLPATPFIFSLVESNASQWPSLCLLGTGDWGSRGRGLREDRLKILYICSLVGRGVSRMDWPSLSTSPITVQLPNPPSFPSAFLKNFSFPNTFLLQLREGEELGLSLRQEQLRIERDWDSWLLNPTSPPPLPPPSPESWAELSTQLSSQILPPSVVGSPLWVERRSQVTRSFLHTLPHPLPNLPPHPFNSFNSSSCNNEIRREWEGREGREEVTAKITLAFTTSNRLSHFHLTIQSLSRAFGALPNSLVSEVLVVDDHSSPSDREDMLRSYPNFTFLMKPPHEGGHARSLNRILSLTRNPYLLYLEDDWELIPTPSIHFSLSQQVDVIRSQLPPSLLRHPFQQLLLLSLPLLGFRGKVSLEGQELFVAPDDSHREAVHQVLFNEQSSRACAEGSSTCEALQVGKGGWLRETSASCRLTSPKGEASFGLSLHYSLHEFGLSTLPIGGDPTVWFGGRDHSFSFWPGLSLNPGLWRLDSIRERLTRCLDPSPPASFLFDEEDSAFEHRWSVQALGAGLRMGYLPSVSFRHTGDVSAYSLNRRDRPWERVIES